VDALGALKPGDALCRSMDLTPIAIGDDEGDRARVLVDERRRERCPRALREQHQDAPSFLVEAHEIEHFVPSAIGDERTPRKGGEREGTGGLTSCKLARVQDDDNAGVEVKGLNAGANALGEFRSAGGATPFWGETGRHGLGEARGADAAMLAARPLFNSEQV
jgi:hypothetical protein